MLSPGRRAVRALAARVEVVRAPRAGRAGARLRADRRAGRPGGRGRAPGLPPRLRGRLRRAPSPRLRPDPSRAAAIVGALGEALVGPLAHHDRDPDELVAAPARASVSTPSGADPCLLDAHVRATHEVLNQAPPFVDVNLFETDVPLREAVEREGGGWAVDRLREAGAVAGSAEAKEHGRRADRNEPRLRHPRPLRPPHRRRRLRPELALAAARRDRARDPLAAVARPATGRARRARGARARRGPQANGGVMCPVSMTYSAIPALRHDPAIAAEWEPRLTAPRLRARRAVRHGDDREAGRLRRARQHDARRGRRRRLGAARATSGSARTRCATSSSCSPRRRAACRASSSSAGPGWRSSGSRTSSARGRWRRARSSSAARRRACSARRAAAWRRSSTWSRTRGWTA